MTTTELKALILEIMQDTYNAKYIGKLNVEHVGDGWLIQLGLNTPDNPASIYTELQGDELIKFLKTEFNNRHLSSAHYGSLQLVYKARTTPLNTACCDKR